MNLFFNPTQIKSSKEPSTLEPKKNSENSKSSREILITGFAIAILGAASLYAGHYFFHNMPDLSSLNFKLFNNNASLSESTYTNPLSTDITNISNDVLSKIKVFDMVRQKNISDLLIFSRLSKLNKEIVSNVQNIFNISLGELASLSGEQLHQLIEGERYFPARIFSWLNDDQFQSLNLTRLDRQLISALFSTPDENLNNKRLASIDISSLLLNLDLSFMHMITEEQIAKLNTKALTSLHLDKIFDNPRLSQEENIKRLAFLKIPAEPNDQREFLDKLSYKLGARLSDEQIRSLNLNILNQSDFDKIFVQENFEESKRRVSLLKIPEEPKERRKFLDKLDYKLWTLLSEEQIKSLNLNELNQSDVDKMFAFSANKEEAIFIGKRFSLIKYPENSSELYAFLSKLSKEHLIIYSNRIAEQCKLESLKQVYDSKNLSMIYNQMYDERHPYEKLFRWMILPLGVGSLVMVCILRKA